MDTVVENLSLTNTANKKINVLSGFNCHSGNVFVNEEDNVGFCESLVQSLHISNIYLTYNDLSFLQNCTGTSGKCEVLSQVRSDAAEYLKTIGGKGKTGYRIIIEYSENKDGDLCQEEEACDNGETNRSCLCRYHYTTLSLGEI